MRKRRKVWIWGAALALIGTVTVTAWMRKRPAERPALISPGAVLQPLLPAVRGTELTRPLNILLLGLDEGAQRADVIILARWDPSERSLVLVSLPRDTLVPIPCPADLPACISPDKLGHAHAYGSVKGRGPDLAMSTVGQFLGVPVDHFVRLDFEGFANLIDLMGGITLNVESEMADIGLGPGEHHLSGKEALAFVRYRSDGQGDIGRIHRTQQFLSALLDRAQEVDQFKSPLGLLTQLSMHLQTNLDPGMILSLAKGRPKRIEMVMLPGKPLYLRNLWFWEVDPVARTAIVERYFKEAPAPAPLQIRPI